MKTTWYEESCELREPIKKNGLRVRGVEVGVKESLKKKLVRSGLTWAGDMERMGDEKRAKRADAQNMEGKMRRGRPKLRWGIALSDLERVGEKLRKKATDIRN